jgi:hypothetical protein
MAGAVATLWLIVAVILWVATLGLWYMATRAVGDTEARVTAETQKLDEVKAQAEAGSTAFEALSVVVGYRTAPDGKSDPGAIQIELDGVRTELGDAVAPDAKLTLADAIGALRTALSGAKQAHETTKSDFESELG